MFPTYDTPNYTAPRLEDQQTPYFPYQWDAPQQTQRDEGNFHNPHQYYYPHSAHLNYQQPFPPNYQCPTNNQSYPYQMNPYMQMRPQQPPQNVFNCNQYQNPLQPQLGQEWDLNNKKCPGKKLKKESQSLAIEDLPVQKRPWFQVTVEFGALGSELEYKLNSFICLRESGYTLKRDILQQLADMALIPIDQFNLYMKCSCLLAGGNEIHETTMLETVLIKPNSTGPILIHFLLSKGRLKLTKNYYLTYPKYEHLLQMTDDQLRRVEDFQISNQYGSILWPGLTDILHLDLDEIVEIKHFDALVYHNLRVQAKPQVGSKLNKTCFCEFKVTRDQLRYDWGCHSPEAMEYFLSRLFTEKALMFINDDPSNNLVVMGKEIPHFSLADLIVKDN